MDMFVVRSYFNSYFAGFQRYPVTSLVVDVLMQPKNNNIYLLSGISGRSLTKTET